MYINRYIIRLNTNGTVDSNFHQTSLFSLASIGVRSDGKIVAAGGADNGLALARYNANGSPDTTFHQDGTYTEGTLTGNSGYQSIAVQKDGKIVAAGSKWNGRNFDFAVSRYNTEGSPDNTFSNDGIQTTDFTSNNDYARVVFIQKDGKILVAGINNLARYNADGCIDNTFSGDGKLTTNAVNINSIAVQNDGKIVVAGAENYTSDISAKSYSALARFNADGSADSTFGASGIQTLEQGVFGTYGRVSSLVIQNDGKIVIAGVFSPYYKSQSAVTIARLNTNGSIGTPYHGTGTKVYGSNTSFALIKQDDDKIIISVSTSHAYLIDRLNSKGYIDNSFKEINLKRLPFSRINSIALQNDGKIVLGTDSLLRFNTAGNLDSTFDSNGVQSPPFAIQNIVIANSKLYITGGDRYGTIARYLLDSSINTPPTVSIINPVNNQTIAGPTNIHVKANATDTDGAISKVEFYSDTTLVHTEYVAPYACTLKHLAFGNYTVTARAYDNSGNVTTSAPVHFTIAPNKAPVVSIVSPVNNQSYTAPVTIKLVAEAVDTDGRITSVKFYNGTALLRTEYKAPYTYSWMNVAAGTYTITAVATDNFGAKTTSLPVGVTVTNGGAIVSSKPYSGNQKNALNDALSLRLSPNPASNIVNISAGGLQQDKLATIAIISLSGNVLKIIQTNSAAQTFQLDVSSLTRGVYTLKITSENKVLYKQFVRL